MIEGPANCIALPEPKNNPVPIVPPIAINWTCLFFKSLFNSCCSIIYSPIYNNYILSLLNKFSKKKRLDFSNLLKRKE